MLSNKAFMKTAVCIFSVFIIIYVGFRLYEYFYAPFETETALKYTYTEEITTDGVLIRDEYYVENTSTENSITHYLINNGSKVSVNEKIAVLYRSKKDLEIENEINEIDEKISMLEKSQENSNSSSLQANTLTQQILNKIAVINTKAKNNSYSEITKQISELNIYLNRKNIITKKDTDYNDKISDLKNKKKELENKVGNTEKTIKTQKSGYFSNKTDGLEERYVGNTFLEKSITETEELIVNKPSFKVPQNVIGKIVDSYQWKFVAVISYDYYQKIKEGQHITLNFPYASLYDISATVQSIEADKLNNKMKVIFSSSFFNSELINVRYETCNIVIGKHSGFKVDKKAVRFKDGKKGVYIAYNKILFFRKIDVIHETKDFVICDASVSNKNNELQLYDEVVVKGVDLYEQKHAGN